MTKTGFGVGISSVTEEVDNHFGYSLFLGGLDKSAEVVDVGVDTSVGDLIDLIRKSEGVSRCSDKSVQAGSKVIR